MQFIAKILSCMLALTGAVNALPPPVVSNSTGLSNTTHSIPWPSYNTSDTTNGSLPGLGPAEKKGNSWCKKWWNDDWAEDVYEIYLESWGYDDAKHCGLGFLAQLRWRCNHDIQRWHCEHIETVGGHTAQISWSMMGRVYNDCVEGAIWAASPPDRRETDVVCEWVDAGRHWS